MRLPSLVAAGAAFVALGAAAPPLAAQASGSGSSSAAAAASDSIAQRLGTIEVTAGREQGSALARLWRNMGYRAELTALTRENRGLRRQLRRYDQHIARLEAYRDSLKASLELREHRIATLDSATAATRAERLRLEAQVRQLEGLGTAGTALP